MSLPEYPYSNFNELNLDWILNKVKNIEAEIEEIKNNFPTLSEELQYLNETVETHTDDINDLKDDVTANENAIDAIESEDITFSGDKTFVDELILKPNLAPNIQTDLALFFEDFDTYDKLARAGVKMKTNTGDMDNFYFREYSHNIGEQLTTYEDYNLPKVNAGRNSSANYDILTSKNVVTPSQGGTGVTSLVALREKLGVHSSVTIIESSGNQLGGFNLYPDESGTYNGILLVTGFDKRYSGIAIVYNTTAGRLNVQWINPGSYMPMDISAQTGIHSFEIQPTTNGTYYLTLIDTHGTAEEKT